MLLAVVAIAIIRRVPVAPPLAAHGAVHGRHRHGRPARPARWTIPRSRAEDRRCYALLDDHHFACLWTDEASIRRRTPFVHPNPSCSGYSPPRAASSPLTSYFSTSFRSRGRRRRSGGSSAARSCRQDRVGRSGRARGLRSIAAAPSRWARPTAGRCGRWLSRGHRAGAAVARPPSRRPLPARHSRCRRRAGTASPHSGVRKGVSLPEVVLEHARLRVPENLVDRSAPLAGALGQCAGLRGCPVTRYARASVSSRL